MNKLLALLLIVIFPFTISYGQCNLTTNLALNAPIYASSVESGAFPANQANNGNMSDRWSSAFSDPQNIYVDLGSVYNLCEVVLYWESAYATSFTIDVSNDASAWTTVYSQTANTSTTNTITLTATGRYVRMTGITRATGYGYSLYEFQVYGTAVTCANNNIALNRPATTSSIQDAGNAASYAFDGNMTTYWSSASSDPQYIYVDLGTPTAICQVYLYWQNALAASYNLDVSNDAVTWTTLVAVTNNLSYNNNLGISATARYVRMYGLTRGTSYGYALDEFQVLGPTTLPVDFAYFSASYINHSYVSLQWAMASQTNIDHFEVERSTDDINYTVLDTVAAAGAPGVASQYQAKDGDPFNGTNYYRIVEIDKDGRSVYSDVDVVNVGNTSLNLSVYPNPITDEIHVTTNAASAEVIRGASLYSLTGALLLQGGNAGSGSTLELPCQHLPQGMYLLKVTTNLQTKIFKLVK